MARPVSSNTTCGGLVWGWSSQPGCIMHENRTMLLPRSVSCSLRNRCWRGARSAGAIQGTALPGSAAAPNAGPRTLHTVTDKPERRRGRPSIAAGSAAEERPSVVASTEARLAWQRPDLHIVLVHPQIPQNAGNIARTCAATAVALHLVEPLGFELNDAKLKRAGLDYWKSVFVQKHASWQAFYDFFKSDSVPGPKRLVAFTVYGSTYYAGPEFTYQPGDWLLFGSETSGLPLQAHRDIEASGGELVKIPIVDTHVRSLNLAVSVGVAAFEALRQLDAGSHVVAPRTSPTLEEAERSYKERMQQQAGKSETLD